MTNGKLIISKKVEKLKSEKVKPTLYYFLLTTYHSLPYQLVSFLTCQLKKMWKGRKVEKKINILLLTTYHSLLTI